MSNINITVTEQDPINVSIASPEVQNVDISAQSISATVTDGDKGDIVVTGNGTVWTLDPNALATRVPYTGATSDVNLGEFGLLTGNIEFDTTPTNAPTGAGSMVWNDTEGTVDLVLKGGNLVLPIGQKQTIRAVNGTGGNLTRAQYQAVKITGAQGQRLQVSLARADNDANSKDTIGIVGEDISNNQTGFIVSSGLIEEINTTGSLQGETWADGDTLYLSGTTFGVITNVKPAAPTHTVILGFVVYAHSQHGKIYVKVDNGYELDELHNVNVSTAASGDYLRYNGTTWVDATISAADLPTGIDAAKIATGTVSNTEFGYLDGVTSAIQTQINARLPVTLGTVVTGEYIRYNGTAWVDAFIQAGDLPSAIDAAKIANGTVSNTEFQYLDGVTSAIQTQLNGKQATLTNPVTGTGVSGQVSFFNGTSTVTGDNGLFWDNTNKRLGIGTTTPAAIFHVQTANQEVGRFISTNVNGPYITLGYGATPTTNSIIGAYPAASGGGSNFGITDFLIRTQGHMVFSTGGATERMVLFQNGNLRLGGTTDTGYKFDATGDIRNTTSAYLATSSGGVGIGTTTLNANTTFQIASTVIAARIASSAAISNIVESVSTAAAFQRSLFYGQTTQIRHSGYNAIYCTANNGADCIFHVNGVSNIGVNISTWGTSATNTLAMLSGTAPTTSPADAFQLYSADITAGNAAPHFRTEGGAVVKLYQQTTAVGAATRVGGGGTMVTDTDTFDGYTLNQIVKALRNAGFLA